MSSVVRELTPSQRVLVAQLQPLAEKYGCISPAIIATSREVSKPRVFLREFGSWQKVAEAAGVRFNPNAQPEEILPEFSVADWREQSDEQVLDYLRKISRKHGGLSRVIIDGYARTGSCPGYESLKNRFKFQTCLEFCDKYDFPFIGSRSRTRSTR